MLVVEAALEPLLRRMPDDRLVLDPRGPVGDERAVSVARLVALTQTEQVGKEGVDHWQAARSKVAADGPKGSAAVVAPAAVRRVVGESHILSVSRKPIDNGTSMCVQ